MEKEGGEVDIPSTLLQHSLMKCFQFLCRKPALVSTVEGGQDPKSFSEIHPGMLLIGFVKSIKDYGVFVQFPSGLSGLAPKAVSSAPCMRTCEERQQSSKPRARRSRTLGRFLGAR